MDPYEIIKRVIASELMAKGHTILAVGLGHEDYHKYTSFVKEQTYHLEKAGWKPGLFLHGWQVVLMDNLNAGQLALMVKLPDRLGLSEKGKKILEKAEPAGPGPDNPIEGPPRPLATPERIIDMGPPYLKLTIEVPLEPKSTLRLKAQRMAGHLVDGWFSGSDVVGIKSEVAERPLSEDIELTKGELRVIEDKDEDND